MKLPVKLPTKLPTELPAQKYTFNEIQYMVTAPKYEGKSLEERMGAFSEEYGSNGEGLGNGFGYTFNEIKYMTTAPQYEGKNLEERMVAFNQEHGREQTPQDHLYAGQAQKNKEIGEKIAKGISGNPVKEILYAPIAGLGNFADELNAMVKPYKTPLTPGQYASQIIRENIDWGPEILGVKSGQALYDLGYSAGNMAPAMMFSALTGGGGAVISGVSAGAKARNEALREGYSPAEALTYGAVSGALEGGLQYALGGIDKLGKGGASKLVSKVPALKAVGEKTKTLIQNPTVQSALSASGHHIARMGDEAFENYLQTFLEPVVRNVVLKEENDVELSSPEAMYSALLGAVTAGILNLPGTIHSAGSGRASGTGSADGTPGTRSDGSFRLGSEGEGNLPDFSAGRLPMDADGGRIGVTEGSGEYGIRPELETHLRGDGGPIYGDAGDRQQTGTADGGRAPENVRTRRETAQSFERRANQADVGLGERQQRFQLKYDGDAAIAYTPAETVRGDSEAGKAAAALAQRGIQVQVTEGTFESNRNGFTTRHADAATGPDGTIYISSETAIPAEQIVSHEGIHVLQRQNSSLYADFYETIYSNIDFHSEAYKENAGIINTSNYNGRLNIDDLDSIKPIFTELTAYIHQWVSVDPDHARAIFGGMFRDWDAVVEASRALDKAAVQSGKASAKASTPHGQGGVSEIRPLQAEGNIGSRPVEVNGIAEVTGSGTQVKLSDGSVVPLSRVRFANGELGRVYALAGRYDTTSAGAFVVGYDGSLPVEIYQAGFDAVHRLAAQGMSRDSALANAGAAARLLPDDAKKLAYNTGNLLFEENGGKIIQEEMKPGDGLIQEPTGNTEGDGSLQTVTTPGMDGGTQSKIGTLNNVEARKWYLDHEAQIPDLIDKNASLEEQAKQAFNLRNQFRTQARELMADRKLAESLYRSEPNLTWEQVVHKQMDKGYSGDDIYREIIASSQRSRKDVNQALGLE